MNRKGFTLIELLIVVAIVGILVAVFFGKQDKIPTNDNSYDTIIVK